MSLLAAATIATTNGVFAQAEAAPAVETVSVGQTLGMLVFIGVAVLIVVSVLCKITIVTGLVPVPPKTRLHRIVHWLARVVGSVERKNVRRSASAGGGRGGGGSFGGGGSSGDF